jgi:hypothetical protein
VIQVHFTFIERPARANDPIAGRSLSRRGIDSLIRDIVHPGHCDYVMDHKVTA